MGKYKVPDLYRAPFPLYTVRVHRDTGLVITAGGGGASKTGIKNGVHFLRVELVEGQFSASLAHSFDTDPRATMNLALGDNVIAAGQDTSCQLLRFRECSDKPEAKPPGKGGGDGRGAHRRKVQAGSDSTPGTHDDSPQITVETLGEVQTDFSPDGLQKCVQFSVDHSLLVTGGADGHVRVWEFPAMKKKLDFKAHDGEIEDLDIIQDSKQIVTVGRDFKCCVWQNDQLATALRWNENMPNIPEKMYRYQACRFAKVEDQPDALRLYTVQIPHKRDRKPPPCYLTKWDGSNFLPLLTRPCGNEVISCLAVSDSGTFLGLGMVTGSVAIYISFSLQKLYYVQEAHGIVVTGLAFLPDTKQGLKILGDNEAAMLSVAVDSRCKMHVLPSRRTFPVWLVLLLCALMVIFVILLLQHAFPGLI
nr:PREDICTED: prolactin regulatory element-binding protein isoform X1 [Lepisosteus oculatus]XP_015202046.1 PREDICTED: prolactin regulatory element-binding protein isoform X1 [Lepisosteus oculatus]XP_015202053.1 PREDICTED: prolactin regulatory element-binding protein isoform X1 [Lepisosteus oculatus]